MLNDKLFRDLLEARGVSGDEGEVRRLIVEAAKPLCDEVFVDPLGSVIATKKGKDPDAPTVLLCAHMDQVGLIVHSATDEGLIRYMTVGGIDPAVMPSKRVFVGDKKVPGVIGAKAIHLQERDERTRPFTHKDLYIDIGAKDKKDAMNIVSPGDYVSFDNAAVGFGEGMVKAAALDDRVGCWALLKALEAAYPSTVIAAFTVQEEVGTRGAAAVGRRVMADCALVVEGTTANDIGEAKGYEEICAVGSGPVISVMDGSSIADMPLMRGLRAAAEDAGLSWQIKRGSTGGNDAGALQRGAGGLRTCVVSVPCRYIHSPASVCALSDIGGVAELLGAFLKDAKKYLSEGGVKE